MNSKYIIGIIVVLVIIVGAFMVFASSGSKVTIVGSTSVQPLAESLATAYMKENPNVKVTVQGGGSAVGITSVNQGTANIGTDSAALNSSNGGAGLTQYNLGQDGVVPIVNNKNSVSGLTKTQLKGIFDGNITNWDQVGGSDANITVIVREEGSGTRTAFQSLVLGKEANGTETPFVKTAIVQTSTSAVQQAVSQDPNAIGFISYADSTNKTKNLSVNGVVASEATIADGTYIIQRPFLFLVKGTPDKATQDFLNWVFGPQGKAIIAAAKIVNSTADNASLT